MRVKRESLKDLLCHLRVTWAQALRLYKFVKQLEFHAEFLVPLASFTQAASFDP